MGASCCKPEKDLGPKALTDRGITDFLCLVIFLICIGGIGGLGIWALSTGNVDQILYPSDYNGNYCGKDGTATADLPYAFYPRLNQDITAQASVLAVGYWWKFVPYTICVEACPSEFSFTDDTAYGGCAYAGANCEASSGDVSPETFYSGFHTTSMLKRCFPILESGNAAERILCSIPDCVTAGKNCTTPSNDPTVTNVWVVEEGDVCDRPVTEVNTVVFRPPEQNADTTEYTQEFARYVTFAWQFTRALEEALPEMIVCGIVGPIIMGFAWVGFLWFFAGVIVVFAIVLLVVLLLVMAILCYTKAGWISIGLEALLNVTDATTGSVSIAGQEFAYTEAGSEDERAAYQAGAIILTILFILTCIMIAVWRKCIQRCIAIIRESTKVFRTIPMLVVWPLVTITFLALVTTWGVMVPFYIFYGDVETYYENYLDVLEATQEAFNSSSSVTGYLSDETAMKWVLFVIHLFGVLWMIQFVKACAFITMSGAVCYWYFFRDSAEHKESYPVLNSARRVLRFHLGTAAFGALIIAICQLIRYILATLDYYTKDLQDTNFLYKLCIKCAQCGMWCLQKTIEFISYFGFIYTALEGTNFCVSCKNTFKFLLKPKNAAQTAVNKTVEKIIVLIIAWTTPTVLALICYYVLDGNDDYTKDNNPLYPSIIVWIGAFFLSESIASVFECTIDTIFLCSFKDAEEYDGKYMSADMRTAFGLEGDVALQEAVPIQTAKDFQEHQEVAEKSAAAASAKNLPVTTNDGPTIRA